MYNSYVAIFKEILLDNISKTCVIYNFNSPLLFLLSCKEFHCQRYILYYTQSLLGGEF